jgi:hypothetical protein
VADRRRPPSTFRAYGTVHWGSRLSWITLPQRRNRSPYTLEMLPAAVRRLLSEASLPQRRRFLCPSSASPRSGCAQLQRQCALSWGHLFCVNFHTASTSSKVMTRPKKAGERDSNNV